MRRHWVLGLFLLVLTTGIFAATATSDESGTGAENVGDDIHVGVDQAELGFEPVFIRRVVHLDDRRAVVNLTLARR